MPRIKEALALLESFMDKHPDVKGNENVQAEYMKMVHLIQIDAL